MWAARALSRPDGYEESAPALLQGRFQEALSRNADIEIGGTRHAIGCQNSIGWLVVQFFPTQTNMTNVLS